MAVGHGHKPQAQYKTFGPNTFACKLGWFCHRWTAAGVALVARTGGIMSIASTGR